MSFEELQRVPWEGDSRSNVGGAKTAPLHCFFFLAFLCKTNLQRPFWTSRGATRASEPRPCPDLHHPDTKKWIPLHWRGNVHGHIRLHAKQKTQKICSPLHDQQKVKFTGETSNHLSWCLVFFFFFSFSFFFSSVDFMALNISTCFPLLNKLG